MGYACPALVEWTKRTHQSRSIGSNHQTSPSLVLIAIETSRGLLVHELLQKGYVVYAVNPKAANRYKDRHVLSKAKSDVFDALSLGHILRTDRHLFQPLKPLPEDYRLLDRLCVDLRKVVDEKARVTNQVISCLKKFYPKALETFSPDSQIFIDFLKAFPDHNTLSACRKKAFLCPAKADELWKTIQSPTLQPDKVTARSGRLCLGMLLGQLENLKEHITHYEQEIQAILDKLPNQIQSRACRAWATVLHRNWSQYLDQTAKTAVTDSRPQRKSQNSQAACRSSEKAETGQMEHLMMKRCMCKTSKGEISHGLWLCNP